MTPLRCARYARSAARLQDTKIASSSLKLPNGQVRVVVCGTHMAGIPAPLGIGMVKLEDGSSVQGFTCESTAAKGAEDITQLGSWRRYLEAKR